MYLIPRDSQNERKERKKNTIINNRYNSILYTFKKHKTIVWYKYLFSFEVTTKTVDDDIPVLL